MEIGFGVRSEHSAVHLGSLSASPPFDDHSQADPEQQEGEENTKYGAAHADGDYRADDASGDGRDPESQTHPPIGGAGSRLTPGTEEGDRCHHRQRSTGCQLLREAEDGHDYRNEDDPATHTEERGQNAHRQSTEDESNRSHRTDVREVRVALRGHR